MHVYEESVNCLTVLSGLRKTMKHICVYPYSEDTCFWMCT